MVVILILPSSSEQIPSLSSKNGCDQCQNSNADKTNGKLKYQTSNKATTARKTIRFKTDYCNCPETASNQNRSNRATASTSASASATATSTKDSKNYVRHVTRVNISDVFSQIEIDGDAEPVTKEGKFSFRFPLRFVLMSECNPFFRTKINQKNK